MREKRVRHDSFERNAFARLQRARCNAAEKIFSKPFDFNHQIHYLQDYELSPVEKVRAVCHYNNTTNRGVPFGESSDTEMCYQFTFSYPAHALENHVPSLIGATNTCW